jgi:hypothetical protein
MYGDKGGSHSEKGIETPNYFRGGFGKKEKL